MGTVVIRWLVAGTGGVSGLFAEAMAATDGGEIVAVASRDANRAQDFADQWGIPNAGYYDDLVGLDEIDAVYVATPPRPHRVYTEMALNAGKHVLCEKPLVTNEGEAYAVTSNAQSRGLFLMEAMWCRFLPAYHRLRELLDARYVGDVVSVEASFGITQPNRARPEWSAELGGGALLTGGCYAVQLAHLVLGAPTEVAAFGLMENGVDACSAALLSYPNGATATISSAVNTDLSCSARIHGTEGTIVLPSVHSPTVIGTETFETPAHRLAPEIDHVHECINAGLTESPVMPLAESVAIAATIDKIRACL